MMCIQSFMQVLPRKFSSESNDAFYFSLRFKRSVSVTVNVHSSVCFNTLQASEYFNTLVPVNIHQDSYSPSVNDRYFSFS